MNMNINTAASYAVKRVVTYPASDQSGDRGLTDADRVHGASTPPSKLGAIKTARQRDCNAVAGAWEHSVTHSQSSLLCHPTHSQSPVLACGEVQH
jgi:hypothetical protein